MSDYRCKLSKSGSPNQSITKSNISVIFSDTKNASFCDRFVIEVLKSAVKNFQKNVD